VVPRNLRRADGRGPAQRAVFLDFWAEWCSWCKRLDRDTFNDASVADEMRDLLCLAVDKDGEQGARLADEDEVQHLRRGGSRCLRRRPGGHL
jgi:thiol:disulfide interchange protein